MAYTTIGVVTGSAWQVSGHGVDSAVVQFAIDYVDNLIDAYCGDQYTVPFASTPAIVSSMATTMSRCLGQYLVSHNLTHFQEPDDKMWRFHIDMLEQIRDSKLSIPGATRAASNRIWSNTQSYTPTFDVDEEEDWVVDDDRLDDIEDARD